MVLNMDKILGANWRTTVSGGLQAIITAIVTGAITFPSDWSNPKQVALFACVLLGTFFGVKFALVAKDKNVIGGIIQQTASGAVAKDGTQSLVDATVHATIQSGEPVTPAQRQAVSPPPFPIDVDTKPKN
jgi:hypothetical protein